MCVCVCVCVCASEGSTPEAEGQRVLCACVFGPRQEVLRRKLQRFNSKYGINPPIRSVDAVPATLLTFLESLKKYTWATLFTLLQKVY